MDVSASDQDCRGASFCSSPTVAYRAERAEAEVQDLFQHRRSLPAR